MEKLSALEANAVPSSGPVDFDRTVVLCIGGTDPSGGAGLPADARAVAAFGGVACGVVSAIVAQNTRGVALCEAVSPALFEKQLENVLEDIAPAAIKTGLLPSRAHIEIVARFCNSLGVPLVADPVFAPSSGERFCAPETVALLCERLLPRCALVTPNRAEAETLWGKKIETEADASVAARTIRTKFGARAVLLKGGHFAGDEAVDILATESGETLLRAPRLNCDVRGTGCQLASAIAAQLARGTELERAALQAKQWLHIAMQNSVAIGGGRNVTRFQVANFGRNK
ncbi:MAG TPA: bifunctional hydroxymethylpyrimidine kinase/phosphomethylpyrimidine kinase [Abditibacteriaceae bacterium]|jgi:hydroxymethylpyrimidine/phosphomethylpyrimidine kinase